MPVEFSPFPAWLSGHYCDEAQFAAAYEQVTPRERAGCKTALALLAAVHGEAPHVLESCVRELRQGFCLHGVSKPVPWAVIAWDERYLSPARILAALMPAVLAGVEHILPVRVRCGAEHAFPAAILTALELAGLERVADMQYADFMRLAVELPHMGQGRVVLLGGGNWPGGALLSLLADGAVPVWHSFAATHIGVAVNEGDTAVDYDMLAFAQPDALVFPVEQHSGAQNLSAVLCCAEDSAHWGTHSRLTFAPGFEACWLWPDLHPDFFLAVTRRVYPSPLRHCCIRG